MIDNKQISSQALGTKSTKHGELNPVPLALIFDVDGVITDPKEKRVTLPQIIQLISTHIQKGNAVAFNSGRDTNWVRKMVIEPLTQQIKDKNKLREIVVVGEKGSSILKFENDWKEEIDSKYSLPNELKEKLRKIAATTKSMFFDENKHTMATLEMKDGYNLDDFVKERDKLLPKIQTLVKKYKNIIAEPTSIDIDIQHADSGKHLGAQHIIDWLKKNDIEPKRFVAIGDSHSDIAMSDHIHQNGMRVEFVFVGGREKLNQARPYPIHYTKKLFDEGTLEYLSGLNR